MTIGEVVDRLQPAYPDLTISKLRFLEEEGLVAPERTPGGYRKFSQTDVARLELVLRLQRDHFLPLAVIREKLAEYDRGRIPPELRQAVATVAEPIALPLDDLETMLVEPAAIPWEDIAFPSTRFALQRYLADRAAGREGAHLTTLERRYPG